MSQPAFVNHREHADAVITAVLQAAAPRRLMQAAFERVPLPPGPVHVLAFGKAAVQMTVAAGAHLGDRIRFGMATHVAGTPARPPGFPTVVGSMPADHPLPTKANVEASEAIKFIAGDYAACCGEGNIGSLCVLVSGGGSAHLTLPASGLSLDDLRHAAGALLRTGATINELNCLRKHCEQLKGGRLARLAFPGRVCVYVLSDVVGDPLDVIASGPCAPDPTTYADALKVAERFGLLETSEHETLVRHLEAGRSGALDETPKPGDPVFDRVEHTIIGNHLTGVAAAKDALRMIGFTVVEARAEVQGEAREVGRALVEHAVNLRKQAGKPVAVVFGGETTVSVKGTGYGGRNQELALAAAIELASADEAAVLAFASDGADGTTGNAGAVITHQTVRLATLMKMEPEAMLENNDSATFFARLDLGGAGSIIKTDPTGTNVNDVSVAMLY
ncbi:MAG: glycerate kinase type-2 family protein [Phycisphaerales bacterium]